MLEKGGDAPDPELGTGKIYLRFAANLAGG